MEIITELEKGEIELDLFTSSDLENTKEIDVEKIKEELEITQTIPIGDENEQG